MKEFILNLLKEKDSLVNELNLILEVYKAETKVNSERERKMIDEHKMQIK